MVNSTYNPNNASEFEKTKLTANNTGATGTAIAGQTTSIDLDLTDDHLMTGIQLIAKGSVFGDKVDMMVIAKSSPLPNGAPIPTNVPLAQFGTNVYLDEDSQMKFNEEARYPAKILAGMTLRIDYHSIGSADVQVAVNYRLHKVLI
jgi:hypothetical protein